MIENFIGNNEKQFATKLNKDGSEEVFYFEYYEDPTTVDSRFLSNLHMTDTTIVIKTSYNLNWSINDVILLGKEKERYQINNINKQRRMLPKTFYLGKIQYNYILTISA